MSADHLRFGIFPSPDTAKLDDTLAACRAADAGGLDLIGIQDHPYQQAHLDTWALMGHVLARTEHIHVFPDVASLPLRPPAMIATTAASLDVLSGGRFELGLGAGAFWPAIEAMGGPSRTPGQAARALTEAVEVIRLMWSGQRSVRYDGTHYRLDGVRPGPKPVHDIGIWLGVGGPKMLALTGHSADGWVPSSAYFPPTALPDMQARIDDAASDAGRNPGSVRRIYNVFGTITDGASNGDFDGPVSQWVDNLTELAVEVGMDTFVFGPAGDDVAQMRRFTDEVVPAVRKAVEQEFGRSDT